MSEKEVIEKKLEELAKEAATNPVEKKQDTKAYNWNLDSAYLDPSPDKNIVLVAKTDYNLIAGENKKLKHELQKLAELVDEKNKAIDQMVEEKQVVALAVFEEEQTRTKLMRAKLKKLGCWGGE